MGKGEANQLPPVPGGVIWWDQKGVQKHTPYPPPSPMRGPIVLFLLGGILGFQCIVLFVMAGMLGGTGVIIAGVALFVVTAFLIGGGVKCYYAKRDVVYTLFYPTSGAVEYLKGGKTLYQPPAGYTAPPGFNPPQQGSVQQAPGTFPVTTQPGAVPYNPSAPLMPSQRGQPYYPGAAAPPPGQQPYYNPTPQPGQQPYYNPTAPPPPEGAGQTYPGYGTPTGYAPQHWNQSNPSNPPPQEPGKQDNSGPPPPAYDQVMNKV